MAVLRIAPQLRPDPRYPLFSAYLHEPERVAHLYDYLPHHPGAFRERARELSNHEFDRSGLSALLEDYNRRLGAPPEALAGARRLGEPESLVVIGGQQPGVLTGPLYTFWKAVAVVQLARAVQRLLPAGTPVVPVFWIGGEDHDLSEVALLTVPDPNGGTTRLTYSPVDAATSAVFPVRASVGHLPAGRAATAFLDRLAPALWKTEFTVEVLGQLRRTAEESENLSDWFGRLLLSLLGREGLVMANPLLPGLHALQRPALERMVTDNRSVGLLLAEGQERVRALGFDPQVEKDADSANLYLYRGIERVPLYRVPRPDGRPDSFFRAGPEPEAKTLTESQLLDLAATEPERLSTNVVLRPLAQEWVFPVLAYVGGPGETSYFGLYRGLFNHFGRRLPIVYPRPNVTLIEPAVSRHLERCGLAPEAALDLEALRQARARRLDEVDPVGIDDVFARLTARIREVYAGVIGSIASLDPAMVGLGGKNLDRVLDEVVWLHKKAKQQHRQNCHETVRRYESIEAAFRPRGDYQERVYNLFPYLAKYGPGLAREIAGQPLVPEDGSLVTGHRLVFV